MQFIEPSFDEVYRNLKKENFLKDISNKKELSKRLAYYLGEINIIHPFREGNGRTQKMYIEQLCRLNGRFEIFFSRATKEEMIQANIETSVCKYEKMEALIEKCLEETSKRPE